MSSNSIIFLCSGEHMVSKTPHVLLDNDNRTDFNAEQISLWNLIPNSKDIIPIHKMLNQINYNKNIFVNFKTIDKIG